MTGHRLQSMEGAISIKNRVTKATFILEKKKNYAFLLNFTRTKSRETANIE